ncbi:peptidase C39 family protein [Cryobacterium sp. 1639]|uniref:peptidase C39 family protein n=1 Tax=Cryobacterium inferilacus TaxID=2866629 RepID=UPI0027E2D340|nr:peptidase C39 family protein [Cryobacterium sp. 1639]
MITTRRPATAASKIAHVWQAAGVAGAEAALENLVAEVIVDAERRGDVAVKWESDVGIRLPERLGFSRMRSPYRSAAGTEGVTGYIRWLRADAHDEPPYYSQTSSFTCGAVAAILALEIRGSGGFAADDSNRDSEIDFWRRASNYPSCEPIGLAVALRESLVDAAGTSPVEVFLDTGEAVLLESYPDGFDRRFREELQAHSLRKALTSDIGVRRERVSIDEIAARVGAGELALLLIDLEPMMGFAVPHWVLAHAAADGVVYIDDPWISSTWGESWVDSHELPIAVDDLDRMIAWGDTGYRGVVFLRR